VIRWFDPGFVLEPDFDQLAGIRTRLPGALKAVRTFSQCTICADEDEIKVGLRWFDLCRAILKARGKIGKTSRRREAIRWTLSAHDHYPEASVVESN
jgi:hypothetical protein